jgi:hypothetical protein
MYFRKFCFFLVINLILVNLYSEDKDLARFYLDKAYYYFNDNKLETSKDMLDRSAEYSNIFPEKFYIYNMILDKTVYEGYLEEQNADKILKNLGNSYFIEKYYLVKNAAMVYKSVRSFDKGVKAFNLLSSFKEKITAEDFNNYIELLFYSKRAEFIKMIPQAVADAKKMFASLDFDYYLLLYGVLYSKINIKDFLAGYNALSSNYYSKERLLFLRSLYYNSQKELFGVYDDYFKLKASNEISSKYKRKVLYNLLLKGKNFNKKQIVALLTEWNEIAQNYYLTIDFFGSKALIDIISQDKNLKGAFLDYSGERMLDDDEDGRWEQKFEYEKGIMISDIFDGNQDGIYEYKTTFYNDGKLDSFIVYKNNANYTKYIFNYNDQSLNSIENYSNNIKSDKYYVTVSKYFPRTKDLKDFDLKKNMNIISHKEEYGRVYIYTKYSDANIVYKDYDFNGNNIFEERKFYKNGIIDEVLKDLNENGIYELYEKYKDGKIDYIKYKTTDSYNLYDYMEYNFNDRMEKYWDYNLDGIYEVKINEYNNKDTECYFDIDYDRIYDYMYEIRNGVKKMYKIENNKKNLLKVYNKDAGKKNRKWHIISLRENDKIPLPDDIVIKDKRNVSGIFYYQGNKYIFSNSIIKTNVFNYKIIIINDIPYLLDLTK